MKQVETSESVENMFLLVIFVGIIFANFAICGRPVSNEICKTPECTSAAEEILKNMNKSVDPCDNFYEFACGGFLKKAVEDKFLMSQSKQLTSKLHKQLKENIENKINDDDPRSFKLLKIYYDTCMDTEQIEETSGLEFLTILEKLGGWPVLKGEFWNESSFDWKELTHNLRNIGFPIHYFIDLSISVDNVNNSRYIIKLDQPSLGISRQYLSKGRDDKIVEIYYKSMIEFAEIFGADSEKAKKELIEALNFEIALANISLPSEERRNLTKLYNLMTVNELQSKYPDISWLEYLNQILKPHAEVTSDDEINVAVPTYIESFLKLVNETPNRVLANYAMGRVTLETVPFLGVRARDAFRKFKASIKDISLPKIRWKECIVLVMDDMNLAASALYVRRDFDKSKKDSVAEMFQNVRQSFQNIIEQIDWIDNETRKIALDKLNNMDSFIAYPNEFFDDNTLDEYYRKLEVFRESFLMSNRIMNLFYQNHAFNQLRKPVNKSSWITHGKSAIVNAYYRLSDNSIQIPAALLQGLFFSSNRPQYLNYAAVGWSLGHEMTHGFDDKGRQYDKKGNLFNWWDSTTEKQYLERAQCIIDQYSNYTAKEVGLNLNGINTQGENIADNGGIKEAYYAYNEWEKRNKVEAALPDLNFTSQQMFWILAANKRCIKKTPGSLRSEIITGVHSPEEFRVIGPFSNRPEFAEDFNCPLGSNMNPVKKCSVW